MYNVRNIKVSDIYLQIICTKVIAKFSSGDRWLGRWGAMLTHGDLSQTPMLSVKFAFFAVVTCFHWNIHSRHFVDRHCPFLVYSFLCEILFRFLFSVLRISQGFHNLQPAYIPGLCFIQFCLLAFVDIKAWDRGDTETKKTEFLEHLASEE